MRVEIIATPSRTTTYVLETKSINCTITQAFKKDGYGMCEDEPGKNAGTVYLCNHKNVAGPERDWNIKFVPVAPLKKENSPTKLR
jgi:hypothetical protein